MPVVRVAASIDNLYLDLLYIYYIYIIYVLYVHYIYTMFVFVPTLPSFIIDFTFPQEI